MNILNNFKYILIGFGKMGERYLNILLEDDIKDVIIIEKNKKRINLLISKYKISTNQIFKNINSFSIRDNSNYVGIIATTADNRLNIVKNYPILK